MLSIGIIVKGAFAAKRHHSSLKAVEKHMSSLNQNPSKMERKSRGISGYFLMEWFSKIFNRKETGEEKAEEASEEIEMVEDAIGPGWHFSENKNEWQMTRIRKKDCSVLFTSLLPPGLEGQSSWSF